MKTESSTTLTELEQRRQAVRTEVQASIPQIITDCFLSRETLAAADAYLRGVLSYAGFLHMVYGDGDFLWRKPYSWEDGRTILDLVVQSLHRQQIIPSESLKRDFSTLYEGYFPEAFGRNPAFDKP